MEGKKKKYNTKKSSVKSVKSKKTTLSNDELMDKILNKKKTKKSVNNKVNKPKVNKQSVDKNNGTTKKTVTKKATIKKPTTKKSVASKKGTGTKKTVTKKNAVKKPTVKKTASAKKTTTTKKSTAKKTTTTKKPVTKKTTTKKQATSVAKPKTTTKKQATSVAKPKTTTKKTTTKKPTTKKTTTKKTVAKKPTVKKTIAKKGTVKKTTVKKTQTKKTTVQKKKPIQKKVQKKPIQKKPQVPKKIVEKPEEPIEITPGLIVKEKEQPAIEKPKKKKISFGYFAILAFVIGILLGFVFYKSTNKVKLDVNNEKVVNKEDEKESEEERLLNLYKECLSREIDERDRTEEIEKAEIDLKNYLKKYRTSVSYKDVDFGYTFSYNEKPVYYAASSVKVLSVLYLYQEAAKGNVDLNKAIKYTASSKWSASPAMKNVKLNTYVKLRDLSKYTVTVSDNTAYQMLVRYIGKSKIREFGKSLGGKYTLTGGDNFGNITVSDGIAYWEAIYDFINQDNEYAKEFKSYVLSADQNGLSLPQYGIQAAHKYGEYSPNYHDLGIVFSEHPYIVAILTREYGRTMQNKIKDINSHIYELHLKYYENRVNICKAEIYEQ